MAEVGPSVTRVSIGWWLACAIVLFQLAGTSTPALADGKFYAQDMRVPPGIPYQRALIAFNGEREILVVQSSFESAENVSLDQLGWVVPVPAVPRIGTMTPDAADQLFRRLFKITWVEHVSFATLLVQLGMLIVPVMVLWFVVRLLAVFAIRASGSQSPVWLGTIVGNAKWLGVTLAAGFLVVMVVSQFSSYGKKDEVEILKETTVGALEIKVVSAGKASELIAWLTGHGFKYDARDVAAVEGYLAKRWVFVTALVAAGAARHEVVGRRGMLAPLVLIFPSQQAVYPLALTATGALATRIDLFVFHSGKMDAGGRMTLKYADTADKSPAWIGGLIEPDSLFAGEKISERFITRFAAQMTPEQMKEDLVLVSAGDNSPHVREYSW